jgi:replication factor C subunit 2/4
MHAFLKGSSAKPKDKEPVVPSASSSLTSKDKTRRKAPQPWVEKYRPKCVDEVAYQEEVVAVLKKSLQGSDLPNLLFYGPPGTGKTSTILAASKELFGDMMKDRVLELNASDERGISVIREKVKAFSQLTASATRPDGKSCPPFKIIILDEADSMTSAAQAALRRTMEKESKSTRFCLICNYVSRIIEPITSRCAKFRFKPLSDAILRNRLKEICIGESVECDDEAIEALLATSEGDMRKAITTLQSAARLKGEERVTRADIVEVAAVIDDDVIAGLFKVCKSGSYEKLDRTVKDIVAEGHSAGQILLQLHDFIVPCNILDDNRKSIICERLAIIDKRLMDGADEYLQVMDLCTVIMQQLTQQRPTTGN